MYSCAVTVWGLFVFKIGQTIVQLNTNGSPVIIETISWWCGFGLLVCFQHLQWSFLSSAYSSCFTTQNIVLIKTWRRFLQFLPAGLLDSPRQFHLSSKRLLHLWKSPGQNWWNLLDKNKSTNHNDFDWECLDFYYWTNLKVKICQLHKALKDLIWHFLHILNIRSRDYSTVSCKLCFLLTADYNYYYFCFIVFVYFLFGHEQQWRVWP